VCATAPEAVAGAASATARIRKEIRRMRRTVPPLPARVTHFHGVP
jgi:hypothetical protein